MSVNAARGKKIDIYCENHMKHINDLCEQNAELLVLHLQVQLAKS